MAACTNNGGSRARRAVTAALVGVLSVGAVPMVALATGAEDGITPMFATAEGAFSNATVTYKLVQGGVDKGNVDSVEFKKNAAVAVNAVKVAFKDGTTEDIDVTATGDNYEIAYYAADEDGEPTGSAIKSDIVNVGKYVAVLTAVDGGFKGGTIEIPFEITPIDISSIQATGELNQAYTAEEKDIDFVLNGETLTEGVDYEVKYYRTGDDLSDEYVSEVKDAGTYRAEITGLGNYAGSKTLSGVITVEKLDLSGTYVEDVFSTSASEPTDPDAIWIYGERYGADSAIMDEIKAELTNPTDIWSSNADYGYTVAPADATDPNFVHSDTAVATFTGHKVAELVNFTYDGEAWPSTWETLLTDSDSIWMNKNIAATDKAGNKYVVDGGITVVKALNADGSDASSNPNWNATVGTYTVIFQTTATDGTVGGKAMVTINVYHQAIDADAQATVYFDGNTEGKNVPVTSVSATYDPAVDLADQIHVTVAAEGRNLVAGEEFFVSYYDANGNKVDEATDAGTYTMKVTAPTFKLSGTTEMTVTIAPKDISTVKSGQVESTSYDIAGIGGYEYLPWEKAGYALTGVHGKIYGLELQYLEADGKTWTSLPLDQVKVTILDANGNEVKKITDEGVYTLKFEARNADAENNYVMPSDLTLTCIEKDHTKFADVKWNDYFIDSVTWVSNKGYMTGYGNGLFGSMDKITRADVVGTLYKMAGGDTSVNVPGTLYDKLVGWKSFDDVDGTQYYGRAIAWAKYAGIVNGHDGKFRPDETITREEFAGMLANYAEKYGVYEAPSADALDGIADASSASGWATEAVSWAVENGIMGNAGSVWAQDEIVRADVAGMIWHFAS